MFAATYRRTRSLLKTGKFLTFFGGEHSISIGIIKAFYERFPHLSVLQLDAHADLRPAYQGSRYNHACALYDARLNTNLIQVGIRSMDRSERELLQEEKCFFAADIQQDNLWMDRAIDQLSDPLYITLDLDVLDPSIMPSTGTPEPGGLDWYQVLQFLRKVFNRRKVIGFDLVELAPDPANHAPDFLVAKTLLQNAQLSI